MVPRAEWYFRTEVRSLPRGRRSTSTAAAPTTISTAAIRMINITPIQPEESAARVSRCQTAVTEVNPPSMVKVPLR